jgi:hypothetical protein
MCVLLDIGRRHSPYEASFCAAIGWIKFFDVTVLLSVEDEEEEEEERTKNPTQGTLFLSKNQSLA